MASLSIGPFLQNTAVSGRSPALQAPSVQAQPPAVSTVGETNSLQGAKAAPARTGAAASEMAALAATVANWTRNASTPSLANARAALDNYSQAQQEAEHSSHAGTSSRLTQAQAKLLTRPLTAPISQINLHA